MQFTRVIKYKMFKKKSNSLRFRDEIFIIIFNKIANENDYVFNMIINITLQN